MSALPKQRYTPEQYLEMDRRADHKSEYISGEIIAMAGASESHNLITLNIGSELRFQLKGKPCRTYTSYMRVQINETGIYTYPDVVAACEEIRFVGDRRDILLNPTVIVEVLSPSTELYDRREKLAYYRRLESLTDYLLVSQDTAQIEYYTRQADGRWVLSEAIGMDASLEIASIGCRLVLSDVYDKVDFTPPETIAST